jgi:dienelactone hydrolase
MGTLLFDLLTKREEVEDDNTQALRFNIDLLTRRLLDVTRWLRTLPDTSPPQVAFFGASTGAAAALAAAAELGSEVSAVVSRGGRPDLAGKALMKVVSPTLLLVGGLDEMVIRLNELALNRLDCEKEMRLVPRATHLFEEPGTLEQVSQWSAQWFRSHFTTNTEEGARR